MVSRASGGRRALQLPSRALLKIDDPPTSLNSQHCNCFLFSVPVRVVRDALTLDIVHHEFFIMQKQ